MDENTAQKIADLDAKSSRQRRGFYARKPKAIGDVLAQLMAKRGYAAVQQNQQLQAAWNEAAGPMLAKFTQADRINRGKLEVTVANSTMLQELSFEKRRLLSAMQQALPEAKVTDLRLKVGKLD